MTISDPPADAAAAERTRGIAFGLGAYLFWGFFPAYLKLIASVPISEQLVHRIIWCFLALCVLITVRGRWQALRAALRPRRTRLLLLASTVAITCNWTGMLYAVGQDQIRQASLGYYINPLVSVLLGAIVLKERLTRQQTGALVLAAVGVIWMTVSVGSLPGIALFLAFSFATYGLCRKLAPVEAASGLAVESGLLAPMALAFLVAREMTGETAFVHGGAGMTLLLLLAGPFTAIPLVLFSAMARRVKLSTVGFLQYITPTLQLLVAVLMFGEPFGMAQLGGFALIWVALGLYTWSVLKKSQAVKNAAHV